MRTFRPIQTATAGLLSLLGMKNLGSNPSDLTDTVTPTIEMFDWWMRGASVDSYQEFTAAAADEFFEPTSLIASNSEWVYLHYCTSQIFAAAAAGAPIIRMRIYRLVGATARTIYGTDWGVTSAVGAGEQSVSSVRGIWIPPGYRVLVQISGATVGDTVQVGALATRVLV